MVSWCGRFWYYITLHCNVYCWAYVLGQKRRLKVRFFYFISRYCFHDNWVPVTTVWSVLRLRMHELFIFTFM
jgi:hypothetical protein